MCARIRFHIEFCRQGLIFVALAMEKDSINKRNVFIIYEIIVCLFGGFSGFAVHFFTTCLLAENVMLMLLISVYVCKVHAQKDVASAQVS